MLSAGKEMQPYLGLPSGQGTELGPLCPAGAEPLTPFCRVCKYITDNISSVAGGIRASASRKSLAALFCFPKFPKSARSPIALPLTGQSQDVPAEVEQTFFQRVRVQEELVSRLWGW